MGRIQATVGVTAYLILAVLLQAIFSIVGALLALGLGADADPSSATTPITVAILIIFAEAAFAATAYFFFRGSSFQLSTKPIKNTSTVFLVGGPVLAFVVGLGFTFGLRELGFAGERLIAGDTMVSTETRLILMALSFLVIAPAEEVFFRGALQTRLRQVFGVIGTIGVASILFLLVHIPNVLNASLPVAVAGLSGVLAFSIFAGIAYEKTRNILIPIFMHGAYNAVIFGLPLVVSF